MTSFSSLVSAILPARNEAANIAQAVESLAAQGEIQEIIVVNDQSTDRTAAVLEELLTRLPQLKLLETHELPAGWVGKNYAASLGAVASSGDWLLFTDADTAHLAGSTRLALRDARERAAALVSYSPGQELGSEAERALVPFVFCRLAERFPFERVNDPGSPDAAANGQYLLIRRDAYDAIGGHSAVRDHLLEDVALAQRAKRAGYNLFFASGTDIARTRMYRSFRSMWQGWTKNLFLLVGGSPGAVAKELELVFPWPEVLFLAIAAFERGGAGRALLAVALLLLAVRHARYGFALRRNHYPVWFIQYYVVGACLYSAALMASAWKHFCGAVAWKGRTYPTRATR